MHKHIFSKFTPGEKNNLLEILQEIHEIYGYLPKTVLREVSDFIDIPVRSINYAITFSDQFKLIPPGKNIIRVCRGVTCHVKNSTNILRTIETELDICAGETTNDKLFTLETVTCSGACSLAPVININDEYYSRVTIQEIPLVLNKYRSNGFKENKSVKAVSLLQADA